MNKMNFEKMRKIVADVVTFAEKEKHGYIVPEHMAYALLDDNDIKSFTRQNKIDTNKVKDEIYKVFSHIEKSETSSDIIPTIAYLRIIAKARDIALLRGSPIEAIYVFIAILEEDDNSYVKYILLKNGFTEEKLKEHISNPRRSELLEEHTIELVQLARDGKIDELIGRESEIESIVRILNRRKSKCPILVGVEGCGKTAIVEGLALKIAKEEVPKSCKNLSIYAIDMASLISGTRFRGEFEEKFKKVIEELASDPNAVGFIDELHMIMGAGGSTESSMDASNIIKPYLSNGSISLIGATTYDEYKNQVQKDKAFARRFKKIDVSEPTKEETVAIIKGLKKDYESYHGVKYSEDLLEYIVDLSAKYVIDRNFPDKAIDIMDEVGAKFRSGLHKNKKITVDDINEIVCKMANIPNITTVISEQEKLKNLSSTIKQSLFGQDEIVDTLHNKIKISKAGFRDATKPLVTGLLLGRTGVGKTMLAKQLSATLDMPLIHLDMSEYKEEYSLSKLIGAAPGYVGYDQSGALTEPLIRNPHSIVLLDEIEKANKAVFDVLLQILDEGRLTDNRGRVATFRNAIVLMTSNVGCTDLEQKTKQLGFDSHTEEKNDEFRKDTIEKALKKTFTPEFRNRLQGTYFFNDLSIEHFDMITNKNINELKDVLSEQDIRLSVNKKVIRHISEKAMAENMGGRPVAKIVEKEIAEKIVDKVLFGKIKQINVGISKNNELSFKIS